MSTELRAQIFVVEDDSDVQESLRALIMSLGYGCRTFDNAESLLADGDLSECDCLLVDVNLPGMKGTQLLTQIRQSGCDIPAALCTGQIDARAQDEAAELGGTLVLQKGDNTMSIESCLRTLLDQNP